MVTDQPQQPQGQSATLTDLIKACDTGLGHSVTIPLFPLLLKVASDQLESDPKKLLGENLWTKAIENRRAEHFAHWMLRFDAVADRLQRNHFTRLKSVCIATFGFISGFELFAHLLNHTPSILVSALLLLGGAFIVVFLMKSKSLQMAYLSARTIAELLRIQFFLACSGSTAPVHLKVPRRYGPILSRVLAVLAQLWKEAPDGSGASLSEEEIRTGWFTSQLDYFAEKAAPREETAAKRVGQASGYSFSLGVCALVVLVFVSSHDPESMLARVLFVIGPTCLGIAATCEFYQDQRGFKANAERYRHSVLIYQPPDLADWPTVIGDVASEATHEIVEWYVASVEREICVPKG